MGLFKNLFLWSPLFDFFSSGLVLRDHRPWNGHYIRASPVFSEVSYLAGQAVFNSRTRPVYLTHRKRGSLAGRRLLFIIITSGRGCCGGLRASTQIQGC